MEHLKTVKTAIHASITVVPGVYIRVIRGDTLINLHFQG
jgi:hypothetical protein